MLFEGIKDPIMREPDCQGSHSRAWQCDLDALRKALNVQPEDDGTLVHWIIEAPWAHMVWHSYAIICVHLRPLPDNRPTKQYLKGATHELWVYALDPDKPRLPMIEGSSQATNGFLVPKNFAAQFIVENDAAALLKVKDAVQKVCDGMLSPDTDYVRHWAHLFGDNMLKPGAGETRIILDGQAEVIIPPKPGPQDLHQMCQSIECGNLVCCVSGEIGSVISIVGEDGQHPSYYLMFLDDSIRLVANRNLARLVCLIGFCR